jgi:hypothetical protein
MTRAFDKIKAGLDEALAAAKGDHRFRRPAKGSTAGGYVRARMQIGFDDDARAAIERRARKNDRSFAAEVRALVAFALRYDR